MTKNALTFTPGQKTFVIAEVAQTHDGDIDLAHKFIDEVAKTGVDAIKFQTHIAAEESTPSEPWRIKFSDKDKTRYDYWKRMEFSEDEWRALKAHADGAGLHFLSSPFSIAAIDLLERIGVPAWKIGSGEVLSKRMLERAAATKKPIILSSGMSTLAELDDIVDHIKSHGAHFSLLQCTSAYPSSAQTTGLNVIAQFRERYGCPVGLSDHSGTIWPSVAAASVGADIVELHVTLSRDMFGPDVSSSVTCKELTQMVQGIRMINTINDHPTDKTTLSDDLKHMRTLFMKSIVARNDLEEGAQLSLDNMIEKKPGTGIPGHLITDLCGKTLLKPLARDEQLTWDHVSAENAQNIKEG